MKQLNDDEIPYPELDPMVPLGLNDPITEQLLLLAARERRMDPSDYLAVLADCERKGVESLWRR